jgi:hypothetical protein
MTNLEITLLVFCVFFQLCIFVLLGLQRSINSIIQDVLNLLIANEQKKGGQHEDA